MTVRKYCDKALKNTIGCEYIQEALEENEKMLYDMIDKIRKSIINEVVSTDIPLDTKDTLTNIINHEIIAKVIKI